MDWADFMGRSGKTVECVIGYNGSWESKIKGRGESFFLGGVTLIWC